MNSLDLLSDAPLPPGDKYAALLQIRLFCLYLADHVYDLSDACKFRERLLDLAEAARYMSRIPPSTEVQLSTELRTCRKVTPVRDHRCPDCDHQHETREECGFYLGEGKFCHCPVRAAA